MAKTMINIKTDQEVKTNARKLAEELGLSLSDIINASLRNFIRTREIRISTVPHMTLELENLLGIVEQDIRKKNNLSAKFKTLEEIDRHLNNL